MTARETFAVFGALGAGNAVFLLAYSPVLSVIALVLSLALATAQVAAR